VAGRSPLSVLCSIRLSVEIDLHTHRAHTGSFHPSPCARRVIAYTRLWYRFCSGSGLRPHALCMRGASSFRLAAHLPLVGINSEFKIYNVCVSAAMTKVAKAI
jgi:hypothetical protein